MASDASKQDRSFCDRLSPISCLFISSLLLSSSGHYPALVHVAKNLHDHLRILSSFIPYGSVGYIKLGVHSDSANARIATRSSCRLSNTVIPASKKKFLVCLISFPRAGYRHCQRTMASTTTFPITMTATMVHKAVGQRSSERSNDPYLFPK